MEQPIILGNLKCEMILSKKETLTENVDHYFLVKSHISNIHTHMFTWTRTFMHTPTYEHIHIHAQYEIQSSIKLVPKGWNCMCVCACVRAWARYLCTCHVCLYRQLKLFTVLIKHKWLLVLGIRNITIIQQSVPLLSTKYYNGTAVSIEPKST